MKCLLSANAKDEHNIEEWIHYHLLLGFDGVLIWDDFSQTPIESSHPKVHIIRQHFNKNDYIFESVAFAKKKGFDWIIHLDVDEYLYLGQDMKLKLFLQRHTHHDTISIYFPWMIFGSNHIDHLEPKGSCLQPFVMCDTRTHKYIKPLSKVQPIVGVKNPHEFIYSQKQTPENTVYAPAKPLTNFSPIQTREIQPISPNRCFNAHYRFQSWDIFKQRKGRLRDDTQQHYQFSFPLNETPPSCFHSISNQTYFPHVLENYHKWYQETCATTTEQKT
jgi:hypothetical protein